MQRELLLQAELAEDTLSDGTRSGFGFITTFWPVNELLCDWTGIPELAELQEEEWRRAGRGIV